MLDVMSYINGPDVLQQRTFLPDAPIAPQGRSAVLATSDGFIVVAPVSGAQIGRCMVAVGHPEWKDDLKAITNAIELSDAMLDFMERETPKLPTAHWIEQFALHDVPAAPVLGIDEHLADAQVLHNEVYEEVEHPHLGPMRMVRYPARFAGTSLFAVCR